MNDQKETTLKPTSSKDYWKKAATRKAISAPTTRNGPSTWRRSRHSWRNDQAHQAPTATEQECDFAINVLTTMYLYVVAFGIRKRDIEQGKTQYEDMHEEHDMAAEPGVGCIIDNITISYRPHPIPSP